VPNGTLAAADDKAISGRGAAPAAHLAVAELGSLRPSAVKESPVKKLRCSHHGNGYAAVEED
jgi:hypothetical protein